MSRKKKKKQPPRQVIPFTPRPAGPEAIAHFGPGAPVRVKVGVRDPDFPELDLGGWTGTILDVDSQSDPPNCHLIWTDDTYDRIDPAFIDRCEAEGLDFDSIWLAETDLELDATRPPETTPSGRPAGLDEQEARIRSALGVLIGTEIPLVAGESLHAYHRYLTTRLVFPLPCRELSDEGDEAERVSLVGLVTFAEDVRLGLVAEIRRGSEPDFVPLSSLAVEDPPEAHQIIEDYAFWFWSRYPVAEGDGSLPVEAAGGGNPVWATIRAACAYGAGCGATTGALLVTEEHARLGMWIGMGVLGLAGYMAGARFGRVFGAVNALRFATLYGGIFGALAGVLIGAAVGVMIVGAIGTIPGAILGSIMGMFLASRKWSPIGRNSWMPLGACIGGLTLASWTDRAQALSGALVGAASGALLVAVVVMMLFVTVGLASRGTR